MQKYRLLGTLCLFLLIVGGVGSFFIGSIQKSLILPMMGMPISIAVSPQPKVSVKSTPTAMKKQQEEKQQGKKQQGKKQQQGGGQNTTMNAPTNPPVLTQVTVAQDRFGRGDQLFWGSASDGQQWGGDANMLPDFSVNNGAGRVVALHDTVNALLGGSYTDGQVLASGSINSFKNGAANFGVVLRWTDTNNWYKVYIDGNSFVLLRSVAGQQQQLQAVMFMTKKNHDYSIRFEASGTQLMAKVWSSDQQEPQQWMLTAQDSALSSGREGLRFALVPGVVVQVRSFLAQEFVATRK